MRPPGRLVLRVFNVSFAERQWWRDADRLDAVLRAAQDAGFWTLLRHDRSADDPRPLPERDRLCRDVAGTDEPGSYSFTGGPGDGVRLELSIRRHALVVVLSVAGAALDELRHEVVRRCVTFVVATHRALAGSAVLGPQVHLAPADPYRRPRPPRQDPSWPVGSIVDVVSRRYWRQQGPHGAAAVAALTAARLPDWATWQEHDDDLVVIEWGTDLTDGDEVATRRGLRDQWFATVLDWPVAPDHNDLGDRQHHLWAPEPHPPLTFYTDIDHSGYKATVPDPDGTVDVALLDEITTWLRDGALPDGTPLARLHLILPTRQAALDVREHATATGVTTVLYPDDQGGLWDPAPPGPWLAPGPTSGPPAR